MSYKSKYKSSEIENLLDKVASGNTGGGSGEDIRYFTEFTVEDFIEGCDTVDIITTNTTELFNAMKSNKVICVPYRQHDKGFHVASYKTDDAGSTYMYLQKGGVEYVAWIGTEYELYGEAPVYENVRVVEMAGGDVALECYDNRIYIITDPVDFLLPILGIIQKGTTIRFMSGTNGTTLEFTIPPFWANGEVPTIEPSTHYELSLVATVGVPYIVLTPFKPVE